MLLFSEYKNMKKKFAAVILIVILTSLSCFSAVIDTNKSIAPQTTSNTYLQHEYEGESNRSLVNNPANQPSAFWTFVKVILYVGVFAAAAFFLIRYLVKKGGLPATADENLVETVLSKFIGMGSYLQIIKVGATYYLLSLSSEGARLIDKITDKETIDFIELNKDSMKPRQVKFFDILTFFPKGMKVDKLDYLKSQKDRLRKL